MFETLNEERCGMPEVYRFARLRDLAHEAQSTVEDGIDRERLTPQQKARLEAIEREKQRMKKSDVDVAAHFLFSGVDLKGSLSTAFAAGGYGAGSEVAVNPGVLIGLSAEVGVAASLSRAKQRSVVVLRGPSTLQLGGRSAQVPKPIVLNSYVGAFWEAKAQLSLDLGLGTSVEWGQTSDRSGADEDALVGLELCAVKAEAKVGVKAAGGYTYDHYYAEDPFPLEFDGYRSAHDALATILQEGSTKTMLKGQAIDLINQHPQRLGGAMALHGKILWHTTTASTAQVLGRLRAHLPGLPAGPLRDDVVRFIHKLSHFEAAADGTCFLRISSHKPEGKAGAYGSLAAEAKGLGGASAGGNLEAFVGLSGEYKRSYVRYQTRVFTDVANTRASGADADTVLLTYDTALTYSSFSLGLDLGADVAASGFGASLSLDERLGGRLQGRGCKWRPDRLNRMHYRSAIAVWRRPEPGGRGLEVPALGGSGVALGQSLTVAALSNVYRDCWDGSWSRSASQHSVVRTLAATLEIPTSAVLQFLGDDEVLVRVCYDLPLSAGVLIEAAFQAPAGASLTTVRGSDGERPLVQLHRATGKGMFDARAASPAAWKLDVIRLRYRKRDTASHDSGLFALGFKLAGNGLKIKLDKIERAGAEGTFDLRSVFMRPECAPTNQEVGLSAVLSSRGGEDVMAHSLARTRAYEQAVPPVPLFTQ